jgi:polyhydroxybutyrate depolymerase
MPLKGNLAGSNRSVSGPGYLERALLAFAVVTMLAAVVTAVANPLFSDHPRSAGPSRLVTAVRQAPSSDHPLGVAAPGLVKGVQTVTVGVIGRTYRYIVPGQPTGRLPLLVVLHGRGQSGPAVVSQTGFLGLVEQRRAVLVFPDGEQRSWNAGHGCCGVAGSRGAPDVAFVAATVADAVHRWPVDVERVYLVGYSNGGKLAYSEVCAHPTIFAAVATYGAVPLSPCQQGTPPVPFLLAAGSTDLVAPFHGKPGGHPPLPAVPKALAWLRTQDGCAASEQTEQEGAAVVQRWADCAHGTEVESVVYSGWGHAWPAGRVSRGSPGAGTLMWAFLSRHDAVAATQPVAAQRQGLTSSYEGESLESTQSPHTAPVAFGAAR